MTTKEKLEKLQTINVCVANIVVTYDMGLEFDIMTGNGVSTNFGNVGQWPCFKIKMDEATKQLLLDLQAGAAVSDEDMLKVEFCQQLTSYNNFINSVDRFDDEKTHGILGIIREKAVCVNTENECFYAYASPEDWNMDFELFSEETELEEYMAERFASDDRLYSEMDEEEIDKWYDCAEENGWDGMLCHTVGF